MDYGQSSRSLWTENSGNNNSQIYADDANDQNRLDLLKLILYDLNSAIAPREVRLMAIQAALDEFDHDDDVLHDEELDLRADHILLQKLAYAMCVDPSSEEVGYICSAMEMVYRAGRTRLAQSFHEICDALLPLIVEMIRPPLPGKSSSNKKKTTPEEELASDAVEEVKDLLNNENEYSESFMEPVDPFGAQRRTTYGDSDESSAESVQIPSGTGEYFEQMNRAKEEANKAHAEQDTEQQNQPSSQEIVMKPIELSQEAIVPATMVEEELTDALALYKPVGNSRRQSVEAENTIRRDLENADIAMKRLSSAQSGDERTATTTDLVPANYDGVVPIERNNNNNAFTDESANEEREEDEVLHIRGGGGSIRSDDASNNEAGDDVPLFDPSKMRADADGRSSVYEDSSMYGSVVYPESSDNPFSETSDYYSGKASENSDFDVGGGFSGSTPNIRPFGESLQVSESGGFNGMAPNHGYDEKEENNRRSVSDDEKSNEEFDEEGGFTGGAPNIRPFGESMQVSDTYNGTAPGVKQANITSEASVKSSEFSEGGGFAGGAPNIRPFGESMQVNESGGVYGVNNVEDYSYIPKKRQSDLTEDEWGSSDYRRQSETTFSDYQDNYAKRQSEVTEENWENRRQSELTDDEWAEKYRRQSELSDPSSQDEYGQRLNVVEEDSREPTFHSGPEEDIFQFVEPQMSTKSVASEVYYESDDEGYVCRLAVQKMLKILRYFSRVLSAMELLAQQPGLVDSLLYRMKKNPHSKDEDEITARVDAIAVIVNLACAEENKIMLVYHPGLLDAVINIANLDPIEEAREHAAIVLMNLAYAEENKVHMVNQDHLLDTLIHLLSDVSPFTRRYASAALFTLACTYANTAVMTRHCDGGILEALRKVLLNDPIDEARVNAAEALFNMARNNSDDTIENMGNHPKLLASLAHSVLTDYSADVRAYSARALEWLSADIHYPMQCHGILLKALTTASQWTKTTCIAEALKMQASLTENRKAMVQHNGLLEALATLALLDGINDDEVKTCAIAALERLSKESSTRHIMAKHEGVMTAITKATFAKDGADNDDDDLTEEDGTPAALLMKTALKNLAAHL